jgi:hypothetical protein
LSAQGNVDETSRLTSQQSEGVLFEESNNLDLMKLKGKRNKKEAMQVRYKESDRA